MTITATTLTALSFERHDTMAARELAVEHAALARQLGGMQRRVSEQMQACAQREQALRCEVMRLRAQLNLQVAGRTDDRA